MSFGPNSREEAEKFSYGATPWSKARYRPERCAAHVWEGGRAPSAHQCNRKPGFGPDGIFCKQHDPAEQKRRFDASIAEYNRKAARQNLPWRRAELLVNEIEPFLRRLSEANEEAKQLLAKAEALTKESA